MVVHILGNNGLLRATTLFTSVQRPMRANAVKPHTRFELEAEAFFIGSGYSDHLPVHAPRNHRLQSAWRMDDPAYQLFLRCSPLDTWWGQRFSWASLALNFLLVLA